LTPAPVSLVVRVIVEPDTVAVTGDAESPLKALVSAKAKEEEVLFCP